MRARFEARSVGRRIVVEGILELLSPCHLGGTDADATSDQPIVRDAAGRPYLPGTTLAGLLRAALPPTEGARALFGAEVEETEGGLSRLVIDDAPALGGAPLTELRDGVTIDAERGIAKEKQKFDIELLPEGTTFPVHFELQATGDEAKDRPIFEAFVQALACLERSDVRLGARTRRGFGAAAVAGSEARWTVWDYRTSEKDGLLAWLARDLKGLPAAFPGGVPLTAKDSAEVAQRLGVSTPPSRSPAELRVRLLLEVAGSLIVRSGGHDPAEPDAVHLRRLHTGSAAGSAGSPVLPGTSFAGVLRHRCLRIATTLFRERSGAALLVQRLFGDLDRASRVSVSEAVIRGGQALRHTRVRIDPWTGGALDSYLFTEDAWYGGVLEVEITLALNERAPNESSAEIALLLLSLRDLATGDVAVGGESGVGRGRLRPRGDGVFAEIAHPRGAAALRLNDDGSVAIEPDSAFFDEEFAALRRAAEGLE